MIARPSVVAMAGLLITAFWAAAQAPQSPSGVPDITGSWERARDPSAPGAGQPPLKPPYLQEWRTKTQAIREASAKGQPLADRATACLPEGMPAMMGATFPIEILQSRGQVTIIEEAFTQVRRILLDRPQKTIDDVEPSFYGYSVGHWEGAVLVAETIGVRENVLFQNVPHSKDMRITERFTLGANGLLRDEVTIEDPAVLERPWTVNFAYRRMPNYTLLEYICEDNREYANEQGLQKILVEKEAGK
ncbi:MAG TPA: hypothetical protein VFY29_04755 [Terriglobia bacterium]|nr:hypothetical protein [Terriglobia bacterium]